MRYVMFFMNCKVRFAPSPTGFMHIGNARIAVINHLFCRKNNGKFLFRIDDTDALRSKKEYEEAIKAEQRPAYQQQCRGTADPEPVPGAETEPVPAGRIQRP